mmetsp:Transcript_26289/g.47098  ORF Transcript_26289/g.47098 Transcript_26289/m.47098 type:complete len:85 (-) Transcript_26289:2484-2738(-)|eukprot:CAMPEP_0204914188 /NCGR_PEP_ID=MMETSP1397-20131031/12026_1 /ASSEMBLY_ACC=CAM_ASM_000891 /TAXON_ID=49980 /ORGANISM="Climacostomum Climacostomum virens, Strain Stock W-24" /LENGTH=84 /DNA_ID=CAMNT_0052085629 /DNA_START=265 /DNA_END=519 /DNA_ORIENTATION=+
MASQLEQQKFAKVMSQQAVLMESFAKLSNSCFEKCITRVKPSLTSTEESCLTNCIDRFYDTQMFLLARLNSKAEQAEQGSEKHS